MCYDSAHCGRDFQQGVTMHHSILLVLSVVGACVAYPDGAPEEACETMTPDHFGLPPTPGEGKYSLVAESLGEDRYRVTLSADAGTPNFKGFFIQARSDATGTQPLGSWTIAADEGKIRPCPEASGEANGVTHLSAVTQRPSVEAEFQGAADGLYFVATVVERIDLFSVNIRSEVVM